MYTCILFVLCVVTPGHLGLQPPLWGKLHCKCQNTALALQSLQKLNYKWFEMPAISLIWRNIRRTNFNIQNSSNNAASHSDSQGNWEPPTNVDSWMFTNSRSPLWCWLFFSYCYPQCIKIFQFHYKMVHSFNLLSITATVSVTLRLNYLYTVWLWFGSISFTVIPIELQYFTAYLIIFS